MVSEMKVCGVCMYNKGKHSSLKDKTRCETWRDSSIGPVCPIRGVAELVINIKPFFISSLHSTCLVSAAGLAQQCKDITDITAVPRNTSVMPILFVTLKFSLDSNEHEVALLTELHFEDSFFHFASRITRQMTPRRESLTLPLMPRCQMSDRPPAVWDWDHKKAASC